MNIEHKLSTEFNRKIEEVKNVVNLIDEGNTIPFIARYRKELTGAMDDQLLREMSERLEYLRNLEKRKAEIIASIEEQGKLTDELKAAIENAVILAEVEDLYRPYKPKRRTRASVAREKGLEPLAEIIKEQSADNLSELASAYIDEEKGVATLEDALAGARDIIAEDISDDADIRKKLRRLIMTSATLECKSTKEEDSVYRLYYEFSEPLQKLQSHRILAINRGEREGFLSVDVAPEHVDAVGLIKGELIKPRTNESVDNMNLAIEDSYQRLIFPSLEREARSVLTERANEQAIKNFAINLKPLLMQPPIKDKVTLGLDPAFRTGCKIAVVDDTGKLLDTAVIYPTPPHNKKEEAAKKLISLINKHGVSVIAIGNGTASRESEQFVAETIKGMSVGYVIVNEAGASVYSASKLAAQEFPDYDVSLRSAVSIARRLQDPLAELVKIDPKSIGVGQYQHDMPPSELDVTLGGVVEDCVNSVGVDINTASATLLSYIAGINATVAKNIVTYREENGAYSDRAQLKKVPKLGKKAFEQCAGFIRVPDGKNILDNSGVHPESYEATYKLLDHTGFSLQDVKEKNLVALPLAAKKIGEQTLAEKCGVGALTLADIIKELQKPGRDPREDLPPPILRSDVLDMDDLKVGMKLSGTVRNVIDFGAFVDIGVHHDGLVHISKMVNRFIKHPSEVVKIGDVVTVYVTEVQKDKNRISLTMIEPKV